MSTQNAFSEEDARLNETLMEIERQRSQLKPRYFGDDFTEQVLDAKQAQTLDRLEQLYSEPYFGRLDFQEEGVPQTMKLYIGKRGMECGDTGHPYIIDWRTPIASLFYSFTGGDTAVSYEAPDGVIKGEIHRKRNVSIREHTLLRVVDSYVRGGENNIGLGDEFLLYRLGEKKDNRLRDIVSTIQAEQDRIIRAPRNLALIIQGTAGSGKTTVALHRLAFLMYQYQDKMRAERMIIFAPNTMFLDYISGVLPELGVGNVKQTTFTEWALDLLSGIDGQVNLSNDKSEGILWFSLEDQEPTTMDQAPGRLKGSTAFMNEINAKLRSFEENYIKDIDFIPWEDCILPAQTIRRWFYEEYRHYPIAARRERLIGRINRWLEMQLKEVADSKKRKVISKSAKHCLRSYIKHIPEVNVFSFYRSLFPKDSYLEKKYVQQEDLAPLIWIHFTFNGLPKQLFDHVVVDEAQDASPFQIALLKKCMLEPSFTILGDLAQGIHDYRGIRRWEEIMELFHVEQISYHELIQSYRSTLEIIEFANHILPFTDSAVPSAQPVFRSGEPVSFIPITSENERLSTLKSIIHEYQSEGMQTIAIIGRTFEDCLKIHTDLSDMGFSAFLISEGQRKYQGGISIVPVYLSKGLEFDAALIIDVDKRRYTSSPKDAKLLYVGCTRALHRLTLLYHGEPSPLIQ
ncbi:HelD family protein [Paenibacillus thermotolerans]|uniref:HelD family protein n=1 Tax=Paenibacillus thermotolerans TaxID=3027807 RepID=UPI002367BD8F|nr:MULTISPECIES: UvrD-helicase domain-containing protein [unclassified Paenibacillus]